MKQGFEKLGFTLASSESPILALVIGEQIPTVMFWEALAAIQGSKLLVSFILMEPLYAMPGAAASLGERLSCANKIGHEKKS